MVVVQPVPVHMHEGVVVVLDHYVPLGAQLLRLHVVLLGEALLQQLERPRQLHLGQCVSDVNARGNEAKGS